MNLPGRKFSAVPVAFQPDKLAWIGGSLFGAQAENIDRFLQLPSHGKIGNEWQAPDWLAVDERECQGDAYRFRGRH